MKIEYNRLVKDYNESLFTKLRNFGMEEDFLELWVPDEDTTRSLYGIIEAALMGKVKEPVEIVLSGDLMGQVDFEKLSTSVSHFAEVEQNLEEPSPSISFMILDNVSEISEAFQLKGKALKKSTFRDCIEDASLNTRRAPVEVNLPFHSTQKEVIDPAFKFKVEKAAQSITHEGRLENQDGTIQLTVEAEGARLSCLVDAKGMIRAAKHEGAQGLQKVLLDKLCGILEKRPLQEGSEHGPVRLMEALFDTKMKAPVRGIMTPFNADPCFSSPIALVRKLYSTYLKETGAPRPRNFWTDKVSKEWILESQEKKAEKIKEVVQHYFQLWGWDDVGLEVVSIANDVRVTLSCAKRREELSQNLIVLEQAVKSKIDSQLEIQLEGRADRNRRMIRNPPPGQVVAESAP